MKLRTRGGTPRTPAKKHNPKPRGKPRYKTRQKPREALYHAIHTQKSNTANTTEHPPNIPIPPRQIQPRNRAKCIEKLATNAQTPTRQKSRRKPETSKCID